MSIDSLSINTVTILDVKQIKSLTQGMSSIEIVETALKELASFALKNYSNAITRSEKIQLENLKQKKSYKS